MATSFGELDAFVRAIAHADDVRAMAALHANRTLATYALDTGAARQSARDFFVIELEHYFYRGDTALHIASAAHRPAIAQTLLDSGANVSVINRLGVTPLHYAASGAPGSSRW